jgi:hypothetical protein
MNEQNLTGLTVKKIVAIHQPNFFPWMGFFYKLAHSDTFIFLDDVKLSGGSSYANRVKLLSGHTSNWFTAEIDSSTRKNFAINQVCFAESDWKERIWKKLYTNYKGTEYWSETEALFEPLVLNPKLNIADYNIEAIRSVSEKLFIENTLFTVASSLEIKSTRTQRLVELVKAVNGNCYLSGDGAGGYQDDDLFRQNDIALLKTNFNHPTYRQISNSFIEGLSVIDAISNLGLRQTSNLLKTESN